MKKRESTFTHRYSIGYFGMLGLMLFAATLTMAFATGQWFYFIFVGLSIIVVMADTHPVHVDLPVGVLHFVHDDEGNGALGFEFKRPIEEIVQSDQVIMVVKNE